MFLSSTLWWNYPAACLLAISVSAKERGMIGGSCWLALWTLWRWGVGCSWMGSGTHVVRWEGLWEEDIPVVPPRKIKSKVLCCLCPTFFSLRLCLCLGCALRLASFSSVSSGADWGEKDYSDLQVNKWDAQTVSKLPIELIVQPMVSPWTQGGLLPFW